MYAVLAVMVGGLLAPGLALRRWVLSYDPTDSPIERLRSMSRLEVVGTAVSLYQVGQGHLPPAAVTDEGGRPLLSWRVSILPYCGAEALYQRFRLDEPWDSPHNVRLLAEMPKLYAPPSGAVTPPGHTYVQAFVGKGTAFEPGPRVRMPKDFPDGTSTTILAVEAGTPVPWTKPVDLPYEANQPLPDLTGPHRGGFAAVMADGSGRFIPKTTSERTIRAIITRDAGDEPDAEWKGRVP